MAGHRNGGGGRRNVLDPWYIWDMTEPEQDAIAPDVDLDEDEGEEGVDPEDEEEDFPDILRAKWTMDGATTLAEAAEKVRAFADHIDALIAEGYELTEAPIHDDYAFMRKAVTQ